MRGRSGSGKTTLLNVIGRLDRPDTGQVLVEGRDVTSMDETGLLALRRDTVSYVVQSFALIPILTATENVGLPLRLRGTAVAERDTRVAELLGHVGLSDHARQRPGELSGVSSSGLPWPAPWPPGPGSCSPTNPRASWIRPLAGRS